MIQQHTQPFALLAHLRITPDANPKIVNTVRAELEYARKVADRRPCISLPPRRMTITNSLTFGKGRA